MSLTFPSVICSDNCPWYSQCDISQFEALKSALPAGKKLVFTGMPVYLGEKMDVTFSCESEAIKEEGFDEYTLVINLPCISGENSMSTWNFTNISCTLDLLPGKYPYAEYPELTQNITLNSISVGSIATVSVFALLALLAAIIA